MLRRVLCRVLSVPRRVLYGVSATVLYGVSATVLCRVSVASAPDSVPYSASYNAFSSAPNAL